MSVDQEVGFAIALFLVSAGCLFFTTKIQRFAVATARSPGMQKFAQSASYIVLVRIVGLVFCVMGLKLFG
jgi:hypothetical protein